MDTPVCGSWWWCYFVGWKCRYCEDKQTLLVASKETDVSVNAETTECSGNVSWTAGRVDWQHKCREWSWEVGKKFRHLGTALVNENDIQGGINSKLNSGNACYHSVQNVLCYSLIYKNVNIKIYRTVIWSVVLYGCETWSLTLTEERRLSLFEDRVLRRVFGK